MDYPLENLGPERFQQVCQALIARERPDVQCFPVAQPDGGRDALARYYLERKAKFGVYQVKYARRPLAEVDPHKWLLAVVGEEAPKIAPLVPKGASAYFLVTNIPGTAHPESGSIDKMNQTLSDALGVPAICWWRDDVNRRLDSAWAVKWAYPEIMVGPDFLRALVESGLTEHRERRAATVRAFLRHQYEVDEEVRFKQAELQNKLLDLFIDVPMALRENRSPRKRGVASIPISRGNNAPDSEEQVERWHDLTSHEEAIGATTLLLNPALQQAAPHVVIEGAPGQGKSTIAQYVCQVHRMKLLGEEDLLATLPPDHRRVPVRLPVKIDLRDFATWLGKRNPFAADDTVGPPPKWNRSMESFIAALISHQSGGTLFTTDDLLAVVKISSVLIVLDGLDEVADIGARREVVEEITKGTVRLQENAASLQTVVTSRPAAFANSPGMPDSKYPHFQLLDLRSQLILQYSERWIRARRLDSRLTAEFRKVLRTKLDQPHLRDLARNPMQLTILLSLILTRGASLPDKRTALYDFYIDLFFSRESEKSAIVRDHRDLLIEIHRYLAWVLHSEAEKGDTRASISHERLQRVVEEYLESEGHDPALATELFAGMVERVVALVSRIQGTFEFEVQPLREYFAACFLFYTAPQSSPGKERPGARPERFDAIARNFYWLNVTRFYAGCYSKGELPSLAERLQDLCGQPGYDVIVHPRMLAATLLSDWVFTQNRRSVQQVINLVLDDLGLRFFVSRSGYGRHRSGRPAMPELPARCGREELLAKCFEILRRDVPGDFAGGVLNLLKANTTSPPELALQWSEEMRCRSDHERLKWLEYGAELGVVSTLDSETLAGFAGNSPSPSTLGVLFRARRLDVLGMNQVVFDLTVDSILNRTLVAQPQRKLESALDALAHAVDPNRYAVAFRDRRPVPLVALFEQRNRPAKLSWSSQVVTETESFENHRNAMALAEVADDQAGLPSEVWATELGPWDRIVEAGRGLFGDRWAFNYLANIAAGVRSSNERAENCPSLFDSDRSLCGRVRHARLRYNSLKWWRQTLEEATARKETLLPLQVAMTWMAPATVLGCMDLIEEALSMLDRWQWKTLFYSLRRAVFWTSSDRIANTWRLTPKDLPKSLSLRAACIFAARVAPSVVAPIYKRYLATRLTEDEIVLEFAQAEALDAAKLGSGPWKPDLELIRRSYKLGQTSEPYTFHRLIRRDMFAAMPTKIANEIARNAALYPGYLVAMAEETCVQAVAAELIPVADIARRDRWFDVT